METEEPCRCAASFSSVKKSWFLATSTVTLASELKHERERLRNALLHDRRAGRHERAGCDKEKYEPIWQRANAGKNSAARIADGETASVRATGPRARFSTANQSATFRKSLVMSAERRLIAGRSSIGRALSS